MEIDGKKFNIGMNEEGRIDIECEHNETLVTGLRGCCDECMAVALNRLSQVLNK